MLLRRSVFVGVILVACSWVVFVANSLRGSVDSLSKWKVGSTKANGTTDVVTEVREATIQSIPETIFELGAREIDTDLQEDEIVEAVSGVGGGPNEEIFPPFTLERKCLFHQLFGTVVVGLDIPIDIPFGTHMRMSDRALQDRADSGEDGLAQYVFADRILGIAEMPGEIDISPEKVVTRLGSPEDELFETGKQYFIRAIQNHNWRAASRVSDMYYPFDKIEARAWLLIEEMAGGRSLSRRDRNGAFDKLNDEEINQSVNRADSLIAEFELAEGLSPLEGCHSAGQL